MTKEEKDEFIRVRNYFQAYFNGEDVPPNEINIEELEAKWRKQERLHIVKEKLNIRRAKRAKRDLERIKKLALILNLREVDCCTICACNKAYSAEYVSCTILPQMDLRENSLCDKFKA